MKKVFKRFLSILMAFAMIMSLSVAAFAEPADGVGINISNGMLIPANMGGPGASINSTGLLSGTYSGLTPETEITIPFHVDSNGAYLYLLIATYSAVEIKMYKEGFYVGGGFMNSTGGDSRSFLLTLAYSPQDSYWAEGDYTVTLGFLTSGVGYACGIFGSEYFLESDY